MKASFALCGKYTIFIFVKLSGKDKITYEIVDVLQKEIISEIPLDKRDFGHYNSPHERNIF